LLAYHGSAPGHASFGVPDPKGPSGKKTTATSIFKEAMRMMKNAANKVKTWIVDHFKVTVTGKIRLGLIEIAVVPKKSLRTPKGVCFYFCVK
jgi:hypothetical protein